ncbi:MAG: acyl-CoA dehydrogenase family protein [Sporichthyaceae bacterium]
MTTYEELTEISLKRAAALSETFRELGPTADRENRFSYESIEAFKGSGLIPLVVPKEYGGDGGDLWLCSQVMTELSRGDSAIALAYNMHMGLIGMMLGLLDEDQKKYWFGRIVEDGDIVFGPISEKRAGFSGLADVKAVPQPEGGYRLYGQKNWGTLCEAADIIVTVATITDADGNMPEAYEDWVDAEYSFVHDFTVDRETGLGDGIRIERVWDAMGMHATGTQTIVFDGFYIPESGKASPWRAGAFQTLEWFVVLFASIYRGLGLRCFEESRELLKKKTLGATFGAIAAADVKVAQIGHIVDGVGDMAIRCEVNRRLIQQTCHDIATGWDDEHWTAEERFPFICIAKTEVAKNVIHMTKEAMSMVGGQSFRRGTIFERMYRDAAASMFQPLNAAQNAAFLGEYYLMGDQLVE